MPTQAEVEKMVNINVWISATEMVNTLAADEQYMYELESILSQPDYENPAYDAGFRVRKFVDGYYITRTDDGGEYEDGPYEYAREAWEGACDDNAIDPFTNEAYEHYIVSDWLANKLEERGEMITRDFLGFTIWGRACTGQAIYIDAVMIDIWNSY